MKYNPTWLLFKNKYHYLEFEIGFRDPRSEHCGIMINPFSWKNRAFSIEFLSGICIYNFVVAFELTLHKKVFK